jgi:peptide/nickel transport system permease protein
MAQSTGTEKARPPPGRRPSPRVAQMKRTWFFLRRNSLALVGLSVIVLIAVVAVYAVFQPYNWYEMPQYCATDFGAAGTGTNSTGTGGDFNNNSLSGCALYVCTYQSVPPDNYQYLCNGHWYKEPIVGGINYPGAVPPTVDINSFQSGPMPLGGLSEDIGANQPIFNLYDGMLRGADWSLMFSVSIVGTGAVLGLLVGAIAGLWGGIIDEVLMRLVDIFLSIPVLLFVIVVITVLLQVAKNDPVLESPTTELSLLVLGFAATWWPFYARVVRGQVLVVREQKYVEAARASGASKGRILTKHVIPNSLYPVFIQFSLDVGTIPLLIGGLVFLGFNLFPNNTTYFPEWGTISALGITNIQSYLQQCTQGACFIPWWQIFFPGIVLFSYAISVNLLSDGLRDALDPRLRR